MKYTKKVPYFKKGDIIDKAARNLPEEQREAILRISSAQKEQERKDRLSSVGAGFRMPTAAVVGPVDTRSGQIENTVGKKAARTFDQAFQQARKRGDRNFEWGGETFHTRLKGESDSAYESFLTGNSNTGQGSQTNSGNTENIVNTSNQDSQTNSGNTENIVNTSNQDSQTNQTGQNPSAGTTIATKEIEILDPRKNSFWDNSTGKNSGVDLTVRGDAGNEWTGRRWRNQAANFATLKSGDDTWERVIHNGDTRYVLNGRTSRGTDPSIIALFDSLDRADSESIANEPKKHPSDNWLNNFFKRTLSPYDNNRSSGVKASFQQGGQMPQGDKLHLRNTWERMFGITPDYTPVNSQESITSYMDNTHKGPVEKRVIRKEVPYANLYSTMSIRNPRTNRADTTFTAPSGTKYDMNDVRSGKAPSGYSYKFFRKPAGYFQQGGQMPQEGSQEELVLDFAVRYLVTMGVPEEDIMDPQGNLNPEHQQELEQVFNSQEIDWSDYAASPDEYMQQFIGNLQAQAQMARKGAKLKRLSQVKAHFYGGPVEYQQDTPRIRDQYNRPGRGANVLPTPEMRAEAQAQAQEQRQNPSLWDLNKRAFSNAVNPYIQKADSIYGARKDALVDSYNNLEETGEKAGARIGRFAGRAIKEIPRAAAALSHPLAMPAMAVNRARNNWLQRREEKKNPPIYF